MNFFILKVKNILHIQHNGHEHIHIHRTRLNWGSSYKFCCKFNLQIFYVFFWKNKKKQKTKVTAATTWKPREYIYIIFWLFHFMLHGIFINCVMKHSNFFIAFRNVVLLVTSWKNHSVFCFMWHIIWGNCDNADNNVAQGI